MLDSKSSGILHFLTEPRSLKEIAEHFGISEPTAYYYLQKKIEQDQILICKCSRHTQRVDAQQKSETLFYISRDSKLLSKGLTRFAVTEAIRTQGRIGNETSSIKFTSTGASRSNFHRMIEDASDSKKREFRLTSLPRINVRREKLVRSIRRHAPVIRQPLKQSQVRSVSAAEKLSILNALSRQPLPYLDLHARFSISKHVVKTLLRNGLVKETWGSKNIGVRFQLTGKGEKRLKQLKVAARLGKNNIRKTAIKLKHRTQ